MTTLTTTPQPLELRVDQAVAQAPSTVTALAQLAAQHRDQHAQPDCIDTRRDWVTTARTFCYQTHIAISDQADDRLPWLAEVFYRAASLQSQPWYPQFLGGATGVVPIPAAAEVVAHQFSLGRFDLGVGKPRWYRQLLSLAAPADHTRVLVARSVSGECGLSPDGMLAYTLDPNGEVFHYDGSCLHWHHICCTPGAALFPARLDRLFINAIRRLGLDGAERGTYRDEALQLRDWLQSTDDTDQLANALVFSET